MSNLPKTTEKVKVPEVECIVCNDPLKPHLFDTVDFENGNVTVEELFMQAGWVCLTGEHKSTLGQVRYVCQNCTRAIIEHAPSYLKPKPVRIEDDFSRNVGGLAFLHFRQGFVRDGYDSGYFEVEIIAKKDDQDALIHVYGYSSVFDAWNNFLEELNGPRIVDVVAETPVLPADSSGKEACPRCDGTDFRHDSVRGETNCVSCGKIVHFSHPAQSPEEPNDD